MENDTQDTDNAGSLDSVKKQALIALASLLGDLHEMDPEKKFDICLKAIRLTDDKGLAAVALESALAIEELGTRAEALVELVNEIDYLQNS